MLWEIMRRDGMPVKLFNLFRVYYRHTRTSVLYDGNATKFLNIHTGVRQGCTLSLTLFIYATDWILKSGLQAYPGITFGTDHQFTDLDYADDIAILGADFLHIQAALDSNNTIAQQVGMKINETKTQILT